MKSRYHKVILFLLVSLLAWFQGLTPNAYADYRGPFEGRVVDQDTGQPIEGAVVFVDWYSYSITMLLAPHSVSYFYDAAETLTDSKGYFYISKKWSWNPWTSFVMYASHAFIFKAGYGSATYGGDRKDLEEQARFLKTLSPEKRKAVGPEVYFDIQFEGDLPVFLLKKLATEKELFNNSLGINPGSEVPDQKKRLLLEEIEKDESLLRAMRSKTR